MMSLFYDRRLWAPDNSTGPNPPTSLTSSAPTASPTINPDYEYLGCATEGTGGRTLTGGFLYSTDLTPQKCQQYCTILSFPLSGVEYSTECYCGTALSNDATLGSQNCNMPCSGDSTQICGGPSALSVYRHLLGKSSSSLPTLASSASASTSSSASAPASPIPSLNPNYTYLGCATEGTGGRALPAGTPLFSASMTPQLCQQHCTSQSFALSGTEYASECYCANALSNNATLGSNKCNMPCSSDSSQICGGPDALSVYQHNSTAAKATPMEGWKYLGCASEGTGGRALTEGFRWSEKMTPEMCQGVCRELGMRLAGVEYTWECYCGGELRNGAEIGEEAGCGMGCAGDKGQVCGGAGRLSLWRFEEE